MAIGSPTAADLESFRRVRSIGDLAAFLGTTPARLSHYLYANSRPRYRRFRVRKASSGWREISAPPSVIHVFQLKLLSCMNALAPPKPPVHGFAPERNVRTNAKPHLKAELVLNLDLKDFFPSIHFGRVRGMFRKPPFNFPDDVATVLAQTCCDERVLPQGAPTSPLISNLICRGLDLDLERFARSSGCSYTRYCDDITFSTTRSRFDPGLVVSPPGADRVELGAPLTDILSRHSFSANPKKTRLRSRQQRQEVTGIVVNEKLNVPREYVRNIRSIIHDCEVRGLEQADKRFKSLLDRKQRRGSSPDLALSLLGRLQYLRMIRGRQDPLYLSLAVRAARVLPARGRFGVRIQGASATTEKLLKECVWVVVGRDFMGQEASTGTAFSLENVGIVSSGHVFEEASCIRWELRPARDPSLVFAIEAIRHSTKRDLAILKSDAPIFASLGHCEVPAGTGDAVTLAGFPNWSNPSDSLMVVGAKVTQTRLLDGTDFILIDAQIRGGNSGGPVLSESGAVLGCGFR